MSLLKTKTDLGGSSMLPAKIAGAMGKLNVYRFMRSASRQRNDMIEAGSFVGDALLTDTTETLIPFKDRLKRDGGDKGFLTFCMASMSLFAHSLGMIFAPSPLKNPLFFPVCRPPARSARRMFFAMRYIIKTILSCGLFTMPRMTLAVRLKYGLMMQFSPSPCLGVTLLAIGLIMGGEIETKRLLMCLSILAIVMSATQTFAIMRFATAGESTLWEHREPILSGVMEPDGHSVAAPLFYQNGGVLSQ